MIIPTKLTDNSDKWIKAYDEFGKKFAKNAADFFIESASYYLEFYNAIDTGYLLQSIEKHEIKKGYKVVANTPYAAVVEYGRSPNSKNPPLDVIKKWVRRKKFDLSNVKCSWKLYNWLIAHRLMNPSRRGFEFLTQDERLTILAFKIMKSIASHGIEPRPFFRNAIEETKDNFDKILNQTKSEVTA